MACRVALLGGTFMSDFLHALQKNPRMCVFLNVDANFGEGWIRNSRYLNQ